MVNKNIHGSTRLLLASGAAGSLGFVLTFLFLGSLRPWEYNVRFTVSTLAGGEFGVYQSLNFICSGVFFFIYAIGLQQALLDMKGRVRVIRLFATAGIGLLGAGVFPAKMPGETVVDIAGWLHYSFAMLLFISLPAACFILMKQFRKAGHSRMLKYSRFSVWGVLFFFVLMIGGIAGIDGLEPYTGLFQRLSISIGFLWVAVLSVFLLRGSRRVSSL